jgi:hypothetical protein
MSGSVQNAMQMRIPNLGPYVSFTVSPLPGGNYTLNAAVFGTNRYHPLEFVPQNPVLLAHTNNALAANDTNDYWPSDYYAGPVFVSATSPAAFTFRIDALNVAGAYDALVNMPMAANAVINQSFIVPPGTWRMGMQNTSGAATIESLRVAYPTTGSS